MDISQLKSWILRRPADPVVLVVGAGDVGAAFGLALMEKGCRVIMTRRTPAAVAALEGELIGLVPAGARTSDYGVFPLDPSNTNEVQKFGEVVKDALRQSSPHANCPKCGLRMLVLACGKALVDSKASLEENLKANFDSKRACFLALNEAGLFGDHTALVVISSRVLDFPKDGPEVATQRGYRASMETLEGWTKGLNVDHKFILRVPLLAGDTGDEYRVSGLVPEDLVLMDPFEYAREQVNGLEL